MVAYWSNNPVRVELLIQSHSGGSAVHVSSHHNDQGLEGCLWHCYRPLVKEVLHRGVSKHVLSHPSFSRSPSREQKRSFFTLVLLNMHMQLRRKLSSPSVGPENHGECNGMAFAKPWLESNWKYTGSSREKCPSQKAIKSGGALGFCQRRMGRVPHNKSQRLVEKSSMQKWYTIDF